MKSSELFKKLKKAGWYEISQEGSHVKMRHMNFENTIIFPYHGSKEVSTGLQNAILKQAGLK
jgi:predicted RNA binding protein YcfA (HicA-like mRNA interferase family)